MKKLLLGTALGICALGSIGTANAYSGFIWQVQSAATAGDANFASAATVTTLGGTANADVTFTASQAQFSSFGNLTNTGNGSLDYTIGTFLNSLGSSSGAAVTAVGTGHGVALTDSLGKGGGGDLMEITGTAHFTNGQVFTVAHDDGATFIVNGVTVLSAPGPTSPATSTFTYGGATGDFAFTLIYGECCTPPAVFETTLVPASVPEPATLAIFGTALLGFGAVRRWRYRA